MSGWHKDPELEAQHEEGLKKAEVVIDKLEKEMNPYEDPNRWEGLSTRQRQIVKLKMKGLSQAKIADIMQISQPTVSNELNKIRDMQRNRVAAIDQELVVGESLSVFEEVRDKAWALHAPHNMDTGNDDFIDLAATSVRTDGVAYECLYRDVNAFTFDSDYVNWLRVGNPTERDSGRMKIIRLSGTCTGVTNGTVKLFRDLSGGTKTELRSFTSAAAQTSYMDYNEQNGPVYQGPLLVEIKADNLTASNLALETQQVEF